MKIIHTSDWHIGRCLYGRKRYDEHLAFLKWLVEIMEQEKVDALLVSGDVFDTGTPSNRAQELYYRFLTKAARFCKNIVITAGNHDSPSFLNAPKELLKAFNVHVIGFVTENPEDEVITLQNQDGQPQAVICAVPYLRDRDVRTVHTGESVEDKNTNLIAGIQAHYRHVCEAAEVRAHDLGDIPIIAMGHLFATGGKTVDGDGVRELYVGSLTRVCCDSFPSCIDYLALGHLHVPQVVGGVDHIRYSGSPIPMGYGEAGQDKKVLLVEFDGKTPVVEELSVPCFQRLERISGDIEEIKNRIEGLKAEESSAWLEIEYSGKSLIPDLREQIDEAIEDSLMEVRRIKNRPVMEGIVGEIDENETLDDLRVEDVFLRCLDSNDIPEEDRQELIHSYSEIVKELQEQDRASE